MFVLCEERKRRTSISRIGLESDNAKEVVSFLKARGVPASANSIETLSSLLSYVQALRMISAPLGERVLSARVISKRLAMLLASTQPRYLDPPRVFCFALRT